MHMARVMRTCTIVRFSGCAQREVAHPPCWCANVNSPNSDRG
jgi:hypothetical protein